MGRLFCYHFSLVGAGLAGGGLHAVTMDAWGPWVWRTGSSVSMARGSWGVDHLEAKAQITKLMLSLTSNLIISISLITI